MIVKVEGKLKIKKMSIAGTGGQALMLAPEGDEADYPVFLYNIGGLIVNFITCIICWIVYFQINNKLSIVAVIILVFAIMSLACFVINALPLSELGTDGSNALLLVKNRDARIVLRKMLTINKLLADNVPLKDMPQELFISDNDNQLDNPLVTTQAVNEFNYYVINKQFDKAKQFGNYILENVKSINNLHYLAVKSDLIYITIVIDKDNEKAREIFKRNAKEYKNMVRMISFNRMLYAYYSLCDVDKKKAEKSKNMFIKLGENYPYKEDYRVEKELIDLVDDELNKQSRGVN